ncbi:MAG: tetraacyldisaccharide 4'-kinase [Steroidobacteraceae bacterium]
MLRVLSKLFSAAVTVRRGLYARHWLRARSLPVPVIVVGNLTVGGTGKTPLVIWVVDQLQAMGLRVGVVSRGYGREDRQLRRVSASDRAVDVGDEPLLIARRTGCAVAVAARRIDAARLLAPEVDVIVSDDGLQHYALHRDLEWLVLDGRRGVGNGYLLPAGPLREPIERTLAVDCLVVNASAGSAAGLPALWNAVPTVRMSYSATRAVAIDGANSLDLEFFRGQTVNAVAGIGQPENFFAMLRAAGLTLKTRAFADHHQFQPADLDFGDSRPVFMTEKDAVKCAGWAGGNCWAVPVDAQFTAAAAQKLLATVRERIPISNRGYARHG